MILVIRMTTTDEGLGYMLNGAGHWADSATTAVHLSTADMAVRTVDMDFPFNIKYAKKLSCS